METSHASQLAQGPENSSWVISFMYLNLMSWFCNFLIVMFIAYICTTAVLIYIKGRSNPVPSLQQQLAWTLVAGVNDTFPK